MEKNKNSIRPYYWKVIYRQLKLSTVLLSAVSTITTFFKENNSFQWTDCLSIAVTSFLIIYIGLYSHEKDYKNVIANLRKIPLSLRLLLIALLIFGALEIVFFLFFRIGSLSWYLVIFFNFIAYSVISLLVAIIMFYLAVLFFK